MTRETMVVANKPKCGQAQTGDVQSEGDWTTTSLCIALRTSICIV